MDLSKLSDDELLALKSGNLSALSDDTLVALRDASRRSPGFGTPRDFVSGLNKQIGAYGDALVAGYNLMLPKEHEVQPLSEGMRSVGVDLDRPRSYLGMLGEYSMPGPGGPARQILQTGLAAAGGYAARQLAPDSALAEIAGSIAAPMGLGGVKALASEGVRRTFRGADPTDMATRLAEADAMGVKHTVGTATQRPIMQVFERLVGSVPGGVTPFRKIGEEAAEAIQAKLRALSGGTADDVVKAGRKIQRGLFDPDTGWTKRTMDTRNKLYEKLDEKLDADAWWASRGIPDQYPSTVNGAADNQALWPANRFDDVAPIMRETPSPSDPRRLFPKTTPEVPGTLNDPLQIPSGVGGRSAGVQPGFQAVNTRQFVASANQGVKGAPNLSEQLFVDPQMREYFEAFVRDLDMGNGKIPYQAIKRLRTEVGDLLGDPQLIGSARRDLLKKFYASLTDDMKTAAEKAGALKEFNRANAYHKARIERLEDFYDNLYKKTTPEEVWSAVIGDTPKSASRISAIRKGLTPDEWNYIRKTVLTRMGQPVASAAREGALEFSSGTFLTNYERMKKGGALNAIFGNGQYRKDLDQVAKYASQLKSSADVLANPSGTAGLGLAASVYYGALGMAGLAATAMGSPAGLISIGTATVANATAARLMSNQRFVHWLAQSTRMPKARPEDIANHLKRLPIIAGNDEQLLEDIQEFMAVIGAAP